MAELYDIPLNQALYATNAKLTAMVLDASGENIIDDERDYVYPKILSDNRIPHEIFEFFNTIYDKTIPDEDLFKTSLTTTIGGTETVYAWGGVHGAIKNYVGESKDGYVIRNYDVGQSLSFSYYIL